MKVCVHCKANVPAEEYLAHTLKHYGVNLSDLRTKLKTLAQKLGEMDEDVAEVEKWEFPSRATSAFMTLAKTLDKMEKDIGEVEAKWQAQLSEAKKPIPPRKRRKAS